MSENGWSQVTTIPQGRRAHGPALLAMSEPRRCGVFAHRWDHRTPSGMNAIADRAVSRTGRVARRVIREPAQDGADVAGRGTSLLS